MKTTIRTVQTLTVAGVVLGLFWLAGFDFDERGVVAFYAAVIALAAAAFAWTFPR